MKSPNFLIIAIIVTLMGAFAPAKAQKALSVKPEASKVEWLAEKVTGQHYGLILLKEGSVEVNGDKIVGGIFTIDMNTITVTDMEGVGAKKLEGHLASDDFFDVKNHGTAVFKIKSTKDIKDKPGFDTEITGDLTIKGITKEISFPAKVAVKDGKVAAYGEMAIDRTKYDIKYRSASVFEDVGDKAISDIFTLKISIGATM